MYYHYKMIYAKPAAINITKINASSANKLVTWVLFQGEVDKDTFGQRDSSHHMINP